MMLGKLLRIVSAVVCGALGFFFGLGLILNGLPHLPNPGAWLTIAIGLVVIACAYGLHRAVSFIIDRLTRRNK